MTIQKELKELLKTKTKYEIAMQLQKMEKTKTDMYKVTALDLIYSQRKEEIEKIIEEKKEIFPSWLTWDYQRAAWAIEAILANIEE